MAQHADRPYYMEMLATKGIRARGFFRIAGRSPGCYRISRAFVLLDLEGNPAALTENDIWENLDQIEKLSQVEFYEMQRSHLDARRVGEGKKTDAELKLLAQRFSRSYHTAYQEGEWKQLCALDEETLLRLLHMAAKLSAGDNRAKQKQIFSAMRADAINARIALPPQKSHTEKTRGD